MTKPLTYQDAGVNIDAGNLLVDRLKKIVKSTHREGVLGSLGGFGGCFEFPANRYRNPVLVSSTDGVGTKLRLALDLEQYDTVGIDLVAMCVNDLIVMGAEPLFFLDYFATGKLDVEIAAKVIAGIAKGCQLAKVALLGGETAEMPGMYSGKDYDIAGFTVGVVEKDEIINGQNIAPKDALIAIASSGPHSNGYSLIRHIINTRKSDLSLKIEKKTLGEILLTPTRIYVQSVLPLMRQSLIKGAAHITGGGFIDNIPRILPDHCSAYLDAQLLPLPPIFEWLKTEGNLSNLECRRTFNCGVGMVLCVSPDNISTVLTQLETSGESAWVIGHVLSKSDNQPSVVFSDDE